MYAREDRQLQEAADCAHELGHLVGPRYDDDVREPAAVQVTQHDTGQASKLPPQDLVCQTIRM